MEEENMMKNLREMQEEFTELKLEVLESRRLVVKLETELCKSQAKVVKLENDTLDNKTKIVRVEEELSNNKSKIVAVEDDMTSSKIRIDNVEEEMANSKEKILNVVDDLINSKSKIVKLEKRQIDNERRTKTLEKDIPTQGAVVGKLMEKVKAVKRKCDELSKGYEKLRKLQHILNGFILNAHKSSHLTGNQSQHLPAELEATLPDHEDSIQEAFSKCKLLVRDHRINLATVRYTDLAALECLVGEDDGPSWKIGSRLIYQFEDEVDWKVTRTKPNIRTSNKNMSEYIRLCQYNFSPESKFFYVQEVPEFGRPGIMAISKSKITFTIIKRDGFGDRYGTRTFVMDSIKDCHLEDPNFLILKLKDHSICQIRSPERQEILDAIKMFKQI